MVRRTGMWSWLLVLLLAVGTSLSGAGGAGGTGETERVGRMLVPELRTLDLAVARRTVEDTGLRLRVHRVTRTACRPEGEVLTQRPRANAKLSLGSRVTVEVNLGGMGRCGLRLPPATPALTRTAELFVDYATGRADFPPAATPITLYLGGREVAVVSPDDPRPAWAICPAEGGYAGFVCPFSALDHVFRAERLTFTSRPPDHVCAHPTPLGGAPYSVTITPDEPLYCTSYWAVQLLVNRVGHLVGVNLVRSEP